MQWVVQEYNKMNKYTKKVLKKIPFMSISELETLKQKVHSSLLEVEEKNELLKVIKKKQKSIDKTDAMVEVSKVQLD